MTRRVSYVRRKARNGKGFLPPNPTQWENEHNGLDLRDDLSIGISARLDIEQVYTLLDHVSVLPHGKVPAANVYLEQLRTGTARGWSAAGLQLPDGHELVIFNDSHPRTRLRATLMEEFFHVWLDHPRSALRLLGDDSNWRTYDGDIEAEAYGSGAAALVPYKMLKKMVLEGQTDRRIAKHFKVSPELVRFRLKVTKLWNKSRQ